MIGKEARLLADDDPARMPGAGTIIAAALAMASAVLLAAWMAT